MSSPAASSSSSCSVPQFPGATARRRPQKWELGGGAMALGPSDRLCCSRCCDTAGGCHQLWGQCEMVLNVAGCTHGCPGPWGGWRAVECSVSRLGCLWCHLVPWCHHVPWPLWSPQVWQWVPRQTSGRSLSPRRQGALGTIPRPPPRGTPKPPSSNPPSPTIRPPSSPRPGANANRNN